MTMIIQHVFKVRPGADMLAVIENAKVAAMPWKKHGAEPSLWSATVGEVGNMAFTAPFASYADYGKCFDALLADPEFRKWQVDVTKAGMAEWVRTNIARQISLECLPASAKFWGDRFSWTV